MDEIIRILQASNSACPGLFFWLLNASYQAGILIGVIWLGLRIFRIKPAPARFYLWLFALLGVALLPAISPYLPHLRPLWVLQRPAEMPEMELVEFQLPPVSEVTPEVTDYEPILAEEPVEFEPPEVMPIEIAPTKESPWPKIREYWPLSLTGAWILGAVFFLARLLRGHLAIRRLKRNSQEVASASVLQTARETAAKIGLKRNMRLLASSDVSQPVTSGIFRPVVILPEEFIKSAGADELKPILIHEFAHIKRSDFLINLFQRLLEAVFFFHPLIWIASRNLRLTREEICDNWVLEITGERKSYARSLAHFAQVLSAPRLSATVALIHRRPQILRRIEMILDERRKIATRLSKKSAFSILLLAAFILPLISAFPFIGEDNEMTPEQLVAAITAGRDRYISFSCQIYHVVYKQEGDRLLTDAPLTTTDATWRWTEHRSFAKVNWHDYGPDGVADEMTRTYVFTPRWSKRLHESPAQAIPRAIIDGGSVMAGEVDLIDLRRAIWEPFMDLSRLSDSRAQVHRDSQNGNYTITLQVKENGLTVRMTVDPKKGFLPVKRELYLPGTDKYMRCQFEDFRQVEEGLWLPFRYVGTTSTGVANVYEVKSAKVNVEIPEALLDFPFPKGTIVNDHIANLTYTVETAETPTDSEAEEVEKPPKIPGLYWIDWIEETAPIEDEAVKALLAKYPDDAEMHLGAAFILRQKGNRAEARRRAIQLAPEYKKIFLIREVQSISLWEFILDEASFRKLEELIRIDPANAWPHYILAGHYLKRGEKEKWLAEVDAALSKPWLDDYEQERLRAIFRALDEMNPSFKAVWKKYYHSAILLSYRLSARDSARKLVKIGKEFEEKGETAQALEYYQKAEGLGQQLLLAKPDLLMTRWTTNEIKKIAYEEMARFYEEEGQVKEAAALRKKIALFDTLKRDFSKTMQKSHIIIIPIWNAGFRSFDISYYGPGIDAHWEEIKPEKREEIRARLDRLREDSKEFVNSPEYTNMVDTYLEKLFTEGESEAIKTLPAQKEPPIAEYLEKVKNEMEGLHRVIDQATLPSAEHRRICKTNLKQIGLACLIYASDYDGFLAPNFEVLGERGYIHKKSYPALLKCPAQEEGVGYIYIGQGKSEKTVDNPSRTVIAYDKTPAHDNGRNIVFMDGHVEWMPEKKFQELLSKEAIKTKPEKEKSSAEAAAESGVSAEDILAALKYNESLFRDFSCRYEITSHEFFEFVNSSEPIDPATGQLRIRRLAEGKERSTHDRHFCAEKGPMVRWDREALNSAGEGVRRDKAAFNGELFTAWHSPHNEGVIEPDNTALMQNFSLFGLFLLHDKWLRPYSELGTDKERQEEVRLQKSQEVVGGRPCYVLEEYRAGALWRTLYVDCERFIPVKFCRFLRGVLGDSWEVLESMELAGGIWFPTKIVRRSCIFSSGPHQGQEGAYWDIVVDRESIKVNSGLPDDLFRITFEPGTEIHDNIAGITYEYKAASEKETEKPLSPEDAAEKLEEISQQIELAKQFIGKQEFDKAEAILQAILMQDPTEPRTLVLLEVVRTEKHLHKVAKLREDAAVKKKLQQLITFHFTDTPFGDIVEFLQTVGDINIVIDSSVLTPQDMLTPITLRLIDVTLEAALKQILKQMGLDYVIRDGAVYVLHRFEVMGEPELSVYDVRDVIAPIRDFEAPKLGILEPGEEKGPPPPTEEERKKKVDDEGEKLAKLIRDTIEPGIWLTPANSVRYRDGLLIIRAPAFTHRKIQQLLVNLRKVRGLQVQLDIRFIRAAPEFLEEIKKELDLELAPIAGVVSVPAEDIPVPPSVRETDYFLKEDDLKALLERVQKSEKAKIMTAPRLALFNTQRGYIGVIPQEGYTVDIRPVKGEPEKTEEVKRTVRTGCVFDVRPTISADRKYVLMDMYFGYVNIIDFAEITTETGQTVKIPLLEVTEIKTTLKVPDGETMVITRRKITPKEGEEAALTELILLVTPHIIIQEEVEERVLKPLDE